MAIDYWHDMSIVMGSTELAGNARGFDVVTTIEEKDVTALSTTGWRSVIGGRRSGAVSLDFMQDVSSTGVDSALWSSVGVAGIPKSICTSSADGSVAYLTRAVPLSYSPLNGGTPGEIATGRVSGQSSSGPVVRGIVLHPGNVARTASGTGTGRNVGTIGVTQQGYAALHVLSASGTTPSLTVTVQSDDNSGFSSPTSRISFSAATAAGSQWGAVVGPVTDNWWRVSWTVSGTTPSFLFLVTFGIV